MTLQKQLVHLNLTGGLQKKDDDKLVIPTKLTVADNVEFDDANTVIRRDGQVAVGSGGSVSAVRMYEAENTPVLELSDGSHVRRNLSGVDVPFKRVYNTVVQRALRVGATTTRVQGFQTETKTTAYSNTQRQFDVAYGTTTYCVAFTESQSVEGVIYVIRELSTDSEIFRALMPLANHNMRPRVIYDSSTNLYYLFAANVVAAANTDFSVYGMSFNQAGTTSVSATSLVTATGADIVANGDSNAAIFDVSSVAGQGFVIAARGTSDDLYMRLVSTTLTGITTTKTAALAAPPNALATWASYSGGVLTGHVFYNSTTSLRGRTLPSDTGTLSAENTIGSTSLTGADRLGRLATYSYGSEIMVVADGYLTDATYGRYMLGQQVFTLSTAHVLSDTIELATKCCLAARIFTANSRYYVPVVFDSNTFQRVVLVLDLSAALYNMTTYSATSAEPAFIARIAPGEIANYTSAIGDGASLIISPAHPLPSAFSDWVPVVKYDGNTRVAGAYDVTPAAINRVAIDVSSQLGGNEINGLTYLAGALPLINDGVELTEEGFHWAPETPDEGDPSATTTGSGFYDFPAVATYSIAFTYAWEDSKGNWHESGVSKTHSVTTTLGNLGLDCTVLTPPTLKTRAMLLMYRTLGDSTDTTLYLAHAEPLGAGVTMSEADLISSEVLYTDGAILPNEPLPACRHISVFQKRLVASGCDDGRRVYWSKQISPGFPAEFVTSNGLFQTIVPDSVGKVVGTAELDDKLVVVCETAIGVIYGQGPAPTGTQGQYSDFNTVVSEMGGRWNSPKSIIKGPEGIWFYTPYGFRLFSRGGGIGRGQDGKQMGSEVDALLNLQSGYVTAIAGNPRGNLAAKQQLRFYHSATGHTYIWDYQWGQWTRFTGTANVDALYANGRYWHLSNVSSTPLLRYFSDSVTTDANDSGTASQAFTSTITTAWLSFAGIQGFQRLYRLMMLGTSDDVEDYLMTGAFTYDFSTTTGDSFSSTQTPTSDGVIQVQHHMAKQKCESMKISLTFRPATVGGLGKLRLTDLTLQVGVKGGYFKLPSANRV